MEQTNLRPLNYLNLLSRREIEGILDTHTDVFEMFRACALAVLNTGNEGDDGAALLATNRDFEIEVHYQPRGIKLSVRNAPPSAFVDGVMIRGIQDHLFAALRDIIYYSHRLRSDQVDVTTTEGITDTVFDILKNAHVIRPDTQPNVVVCWGSHSIGRTEYEYTKEVGYQLGLRGCDIATGCGTGAMKGPMKGAAIGHAKQQFTGRYIGLTEPGIIAAESPNPIVNELVILPDIEKRLEAFVRLAHAVIVFPGGVGTIEEILYALSIRLHPSNRRAPLPLIFTGPEASRGYFDMIDRYLRTVLGPAIAEHYEIIIDDPAAVAVAAKSEIGRIKRFRKRNQEAYNYNWSLHLEPSLQQPFEPTHQNMASLDLTEGGEPHVLAAQLRRAMSGIVAGNVKPTGVAAVREHGPFRLTGSQRLIEATDEVLQTCIDQGRMKLGSAAYRPCYEMVHSDAA